MIGIYMYKNKINGKKYVGQSIQIEYRHTQHLTRKKGQLIDEKIAKYGIENFDFIVLEECLPEQLNEREYYYMMLYETLVPKGYNIGNPISSYGEFNNNTSLKDRDVISIRQRVHINKESTKKVYADYSNLVSYDSFWQILRGITWKHLDMSIINSLPVSVTGENNPRTSFTNEEVFSIRHIIHTQGKNWKEVHNEYSSRISEEAFRKMITGQTWKSVDTSMIKPLVVNRLNTPKAKLTKENVVKMRNMYENENKSVNEIHELYNHVTKITIKRVLNYETWKNC